MFYLTKLENDDLGFANQDNCRAGSGTVTILRIYFFLRIFLTDVIRWFKLSVNKKIPNRFWILQFGQTIDDLSLFSIGNYKNIALRMTVWY